MEALSLEQLQAKAQELMDTFGAKGEIMDIVMWLDKLQRGTPVAVEPAPGDELLIEETATPTAEETAIANTAYTVFGTKNQKEVVASLKQFSIVLKQRDEAQTKLRKLEHTAAVKQAIKDRKLEPHQEEQALKDDPDEFRIAMKYAQPRLDTESITANSNINKDNIPTLEEIKADKNVKAWCNKNSLSLEHYAASWQKTKMPLSEHPTIE